MASKERIARLNSLLKEVISEAIRRDIHHEPIINQFVSVTNVDITSDLSFAQVYVSIMASDPQKIATLERLKELSHQITMLCAKKVTIRHFPRLEFKIDTGLEKQLRIEDMLSKISQERETRNTD
ncbi:MAG: 30S ribosome-binding factor RbfA [Verrucomicrobia bacterium]|nr:30S ribosome-binding factor RbfA [Verrucomicrobiota bacterium]